MTNTEKGKVKKAVEQRNGFHSSSRIMLCGSIHEHQAGGFQMVDMRRTLGSLH